MEKIAYSEPAEYFPEDIRKEFGLGEYYKEDQEDDKKKKDDNQQFKDYINKK